jgi:hypothetical protein
VLDGQLYLVNFNDNQAELDTCLIAKTNMGWCWDHASSPKVLQEETASVEAVCT